METKSFNPTDPDSLCDAVNALVRFRRHDLIDGPATEAHAPPGSTPTLHAIKAAWNAASVAHRNDTWPWLVLAKVNFAKRSRTLCRSRFCHTGSSTSWPAALASAWNQPRRGRNCPGPNETRC